MINLRLSEICKFVKKNSVVADIGTDHGIVPLYLSRNNISKKIIATDISANSLSKLDEKLAYATDINNIETRVSDGLEYIDEYEVDTLIISGMGGILVKDILSAKMNVTESINTMILSPNNSLDTLRQFLFENNFKVVDESDIYENDKYYQILKVEKGVDFYNKPEEFLYGKHLIRKKSKHLKRFLNDEYKKYEKALELINKSESNKEKIERLEQKIAQIGSILNDMC